PRVEGRRAPGVGEGAYAAVPDGAHARPGLAANSGWQHEQIHAMGAAQKTFLWLVDGLVGWLHQLPEQDCRQQGLPRLRGPSARWLWVQQRCRGLDLLAGARPKRTFWPPSRLVH